MASNISEILIAANTHVHPLYFRFDGCNVDLVTTTGFFNYARGVNESNAILFLSGFIAGKLFEESRNQNGK